jgi:ATP-binding cassette subfamily G (WHITE) protein 2 (SNQ2)
MIRGVSGGEKKRVSIGEALITKASCQCWDNSTKGLDASTAMEYVSSLRSLTNMTRISTFVALYQAGESLYELFDKVILIDGGRCAYFGRTEYHPLLLILIFGSLILPRDAKLYFESLGFVCPPRWTTADFLTSVTDPHERHVKPGWEGRIPRNAEEFETAFKNSEFAKKNLEDIQSFEAEVQAQKAVRAQEVTKATKTKNYTVSFIDRVLPPTVSSDHIHRSRFINKSLHAPLASSK